MENNTFYDAPNDYRNYLAHHGVKGMKWGQRKEYIPHPRVGSANPNTPMSSLGRESLGDKLRKRKAAKIQKRMDIAKSKADAERRKILRSDPRANELGEKMMASLRNSENKFYSDKKYRKQVTDFIAKSGRSDAEYWSKALSEKDVKDRNPEWVFDAVELYSKEKDPDYVIMLNEYNRIGRR